MKIKSGENISIREFFKRWKNGIINLTPIQKASNERTATVISLIGFIASLIAMIIFHDKFFVSWFAYGLILVFVGSIYSNLLKYLSLNQMIKQLKKVDSNSINIDDIMNKVDVALDENIIEKTLDEQPETIRRIEVKRNE